MSHVAEIAGGVALAVAAVGGALAVLPRAKPEAVAIALEIQPKPVERAQPVHEKSEAERIDELRSQADWYASLGDHDEAQRLRNEAAALAGTSL